MKSSGRGAASHYPCLSLEAIKAILQQPLDPHGGSTIAEHIADDAHLWLWVTTPFLVHEPWQEVVRAWGFRAKTLVTWVKGHLIVKSSSRGVEGALRLQFGQGHYTRGCTEHLIFCVRGKGARLVRAHDQPNVFLAPRTDHSRKPDESYRIIEAISPEPRLELFARRRRDGWYVWGNQVE